LRFCYDRAVPLSAAQFRANIVRRFEATHAEDEAAALAARALLPEAVELLVTRLRPRRVVLFGSLANGLFHAVGSDIDLAVDGVGIGAPADLMQALRALFGRRVDLVDPELAAPFIQEAIEFEGELIHDPG
jgi:predicted nucleotidyltransferase